MDINIQSPSFRPYSRQFVTVNSSRWALSQRAQMDWSVRLSREFKFICNKNNCPNGVVFFATFTFDEEHLLYLDKCPFGHYKGVDFIDGVPYIKDFFRTDFIDRNGERVKCFDNERISENVMRSLRQICGLKFRYVVFPEYGSSKTYVDERGRLRVGTKRPHYHVLFFFYDFNLIFPFCYTDKSGKVLCFNNFHDILLHFYGACESQCLDLQVITSDFGFSKYVSKYVTKNIHEDIFPESFNLRVKVARKVVRDLRPFDYEYLRDDLRKVLDDSVLFLKWYETHRPKLLCSNGIGLSLPYTEKELYDGCVQVFNGKKFVSVPIPAYNIRKDCFTLVKHYSRKYWCVKDGFIKVLDSDSTYSYHWSLKDDKVSTLMHHDELQLSKLRDTVFKVLNLTGSFHPQFVDYVKAHSCYDFSYKSYDILCSELRRDIDKLFGTFDFPLMLYYYRRFFSAYSVEHLYYHFGLEIPVPEYDLDTDDNLSLSKLHEEFNMFYSVGKFLSD